MRTLSEQQEFDQMLEAFFKSGGKVVRLKKGAYGYDSAAYGGLGTWWDGTGKPPWLRGIEKRYGKTYEDKFGEYYE